MIKRSTFKITNLFILTLFWMLLNGSCIKESFSPSQANSFIRFYGSYRQDRGIDILTLPDGGYAFTGTTVTDNLKQEIILFRTDRYGNELQEPVTFGGRYYNYPNRLLRLEDGGFAILGTTFNISKDWLVVSNMYLIRTDGEGRELWSKEYGGFSNEEGYNFVETSDGGFILIGSTEDFEAERLDIHLVKTNSEGDTLWTRKHGGILDDSGNSIAESADGFIYTGYTSSFSLGDQYGPNIFVAKTNSAGRIIYPWTYGGTGADEGISIIPVSGHGYYLLGNTTDPLSNKSKVFLARIEENISKPAWIKEFGDEADHIASCFKITDQGDIVIAGTVKSSAVNHAIFLLKTDATGNQKFMKTFSGMGIQSAKAIDLTDDGGYIIIGSTELGRNSMITLIKTKAGGEL